MEILIAALHSPINQLSGQEWCALGTLAWLFGLLGWSFGDYRGYSRGWKNGKEFVEQMRPYSVTEKDAFEKGVQHGLNMMRQADD